jgi:hypothetical protein
MVLQTTFAALLVLLVAASAEASRASLVIDQQTRHLLQARPLNCTRIVPHCNLCRNQRSTGLRSELVCTSCEGGYRLRRDGLSKICGELHLQCIVR